MTWLYVEICLTDTSRKWAIIDTLNTALTEAAILTLMLVIRR